MLLLLVALLMLRRLRAEPRLLLLWTRMVPLLRPLGEDIVTIPRWGLRGSDIYILALCCIVMVPLLLFRSTFRLEPFIGERISIEGDF